MGNPAVVLPSAPTPCRDCREYRGQGFDATGPYVSCGQHAYFRKDQDAGCKHWGRAEVPRWVGRRIIVCGGRAFDDWERFCEAMDAVLAKGPIAVIVQGGAPGADSMAQQWALQRGIPFEQHDADWKGLGRKAGPIRNQAMADAGADGVVAFPGGTGTAGMCRLAQAAGIPVWRPFG